MSNIWGIMITKLGGDYASTTFADEKTYTDIVNYLSTEEGKKRSTSKLIHGVKVDGEKIDYVADSVLVLLERANSGEEIDFKSELEKLVSEDKK